MADKLYSVDLGEYGTLSGTLDQMDSMMRILNQAGLYSVRKMDRAVEDGNESSEAYYKHIWDSTGDAHIKIWDAIRDDYIKEATDEH